MPHLVDEPSSESTNSRAKRGIREADVARKGPHCSKNIRGASACSFWVNVNVSLV